MLWRFSWYIKGCVFFFESLFKSSITSDFSSSQGGEFSCTVS